MGYMRPGEGDLTGLDDSDRQTGWGALLAAAQRGDANAYRRFLEEILPFARNVARRKCRSETLVEDIVQDSLLTLHRVRHTYRPGQPVKPWLATIVIRRAIDVNRRQGRIERRETWNPEVYETFSDTATNQGEASDSSEAVARMMTNLTPRQREAIELVKLKEMTLAEAEAATGQSAGSIKVNVHRALQRLRRLVAGEEPE